MQLDRKVTLGIIVPIFWPTIFIHDGQPTPCRPAMCPCSYATRVIGSQLSPSFAVDEQAVMQGIIQDLQLQGKADAAMR